MRRSCFSKSLSSLFMVAAFFLRRHEVAQHFDTGFVLSMSRRCRQLECFSDLTKRHLIPDVSHDDVSRDGIKN